MVGGSLVREARRRAAITQVELGSRLGVPQSTVARWETGRISPSFDNVARAVRACGLELAVQLVPEDAQLAALVDEHLAMSTTQRFAQNNYLVALVDGARRRMAAAHG